MAPRFDVEEHLPKALQERLDSWYLSPPKSQYQAYGPLNAYLQGHKFPSTHFLSKPQKMLRQGLVDDPIDETDPIHDDERKDPSYMDADEVEAAAEAKAKVAAAAAATDGNDTDEETHDEPDGNEDDGDSGNEDADISMGSIDSHGIAVSNESIFLPDFSVDRYYGADIDDNPNPDKIRVVVEVASLSRVLDIEKKNKSEGSQRNAKDDFKLDVQFQLNAYLSRSAQKHDGRILGVALLGNEVLLRKARKVGSEAGVYVIPDIGRRWISFFDPRFVEQLNIMRDIELNS